MSKIYTAADQLIGKTPLLELSRLEKKALALLRAQMAAP